MITKTFENVKEDVSKDFQTKKFRIAVRPVSTVRHIDIISQVICRQLSVSVQSQNEEGGYDGLLVLVLDCRQPLLHVIQLKWSLVLGFIIANFLTLTTAVV